MGNSTFFDDLGFSFESLSDGEKRLLDMLSSEDMYNHPTSIYDLLQLPSMEVQLQQQQQQPLASAVAETSEVLNDAETPNSSSICTSSPDALKDDDQQSKRSQAGNKKKMAKSEKKITKKQREPRFAFMTKTDIDNLDDGFRWRKYGQKAVKNSPFPRSYYRCTSTSCGVLKRVERSSTDPSIVVTTYEGNHKHLCPVTHPGAIAIFPERPCPFRGDAYSIQQSQYHQQIVQLQQQGYATGPTSFPNWRATSYSPLDVPDHVAEETHLSFLPSCLFRDQGLLQDMVSSRMQSEEKKNAERDFE